MFRLEGNKGSTEFEAGSAIELFPLEPDALKELCDPNSRFKTGTAFFEWSKSFVEWKSFRVKRITKLALGPEEVIV